MYIQSIAADEFRCFQHLDVQFNYPGKQGTSKSPKIENVTLLLGNNGAGKSAVMKALAWGALARVMPSSGLLPRYFVRREPQMPPTKSAMVTAQLLLHQQDGVAGSTPESQLSQGMIQLVQTTEQFITTAISGEELTSLIFNEFSPANFVVGYGATRRSESTQSDPSTEKTRTPRYQRVASLFEDNVALTSTSVALSRIMSQGRFTEVANILNGMLPQEVHLNPNYDPQSGEFTVAGVQLFSSDLSDGYRAFVAWTLDLLYHLTVVAPPGTPLSDLTGVVLIDEIDLHLHPKWQRTVVETAAQTFPKLQFIVSSHSPLVVGSLESSNILIAEDHAFRSATTKAQGLSSDQLLTSEYFGLPTPRSAETVRQLSDLAGKAVSGDDEAAVQFLTSLNEGIESGEQP